MPRTYDQVYAASGLSYISTFTWNCNFQDTLNLYSSRYIGLYHMSQSIMATFLAFARAYNCACKPIWLAHTCSSTHAFSTTFTDYSLKKFPWWNNVFNKNFFSSISSSDSTISSSKFRVSSFLHLSSPWHGQISVHGNLLSSHSHLLQQILRPLQEQTGSLRTWALTGPSKKVGTIVSSCCFQPWPTGDGTFGTAWWAFVHVFACHDALQRCCLKLASEGGSYARDVSFVVANRKRRSFKLLWYLPVFCFGS